MDFLFRFLLHWACPDLLFSRQDYHISNCSSYFWTNPNGKSGQVLWGAAAAAVLGMTLADWQRKREEEEAARLAAERANEVPDDVLARRRAKVMAKNQAQRAQESRWEAARVAQDIKAKQQAAQNTLTKNKNLFAAEAQMDKVKPVTPYVAASYIDKDEEQWLKGKESQRAWAAVQAREVQRKESEEKIKPWWMPNTFYMNAYEVYKALPSARLNNERYPVPLFQIPLANLISFGTVTSQVLSTNNNNSVGINPDGVSANASYNNISLSLIANTQTPSVALNMRIASPVIFSKGRESANLGYSVIARAQLNNLYDAAFNMDINFVDLKIENQPITKGNIREGVYIEVNAITAVVLAGIIIFTPIDDIGAILTGMGIAIEKGITNIFTNPLPAQ
jgi:hypothetical protein